MNNSEGQILTIDAGTSSLKAVLYSSAGKIAGASSQWYSYQTPEPGWAEGNPEDWWQALRDALADLAGQGFALDQIEAVSFTGQMHTALLLDDQAKVIPPTILWLDRRAATETDELQATLQLPPFQLNSTYTLPKLLWLRHHMPGVLDRTRTMLWPKDYLRFRMTGEVCTDLTEPGGAVLLDWETRAWAVERLQIVGLDPSVLPPIRAADASGGPIRPEVAEMLGLSPDIRVVVGMGDVAAIFGAAPPKPGRATCSMGSSSMVFVPLEAKDPVRDPAQRLYVYPFGPYPMLGGVSSTTGSCLVWAYEKLARGKEQSVSFDEWLEAALDIDPGADGLCFIPYLAGERSPYWSDEIRGGFHGLRLSHDQRHIGRAVMEGVAYSLRHLLDLYEELGVQIDEIALAGGGSATQGWPEIIADACQRDVMIYAGKETVTRVLYALCQAHLGHERLEASLLRTFDEPAIIHCRKEFGPVYDSGYQRYRAFAHFAWAQAETLP